MNNLLKKCSTILTCPRNNPKTSLSCGINEKLPKIRLEAMVHSMESFPET